MRPYSNTMTARLTNACKKPIIVLLKSYAIGYMTDFEISLDKVIIKGYHDWFYYKCKCTIKHKDLIVVMRTDEHRECIYIVDKSIYFGKKVRSCVWIDKIKNDGCFSSPYKNTIEFKEFKEFLTSAGIEIINYNSDRNKIDFYVPIA